jgi:hypothetical protein
MPFHKIACRTALIVAVLGMPTAAMSGTEKSTLGRAIAEQILNVDSIHTIERHQIFPAQRTDAKFFGFDPEMQTILPSAPSRSERLDATLRAVIWRENAGFQDDRLVPIHDVAHRKNWLRNAQNHHVAAYLGFLPGRTRLPRVQTAGWK